MVLLLLSLLQAGKLRRVDHEMTTDGPACGSRGQALHHCAWAAVKAACGFHFLDPSFQAAPRTRGHLLPRERFTNSTLPLCCRRLREHGSPPAPPAMHMATNIVSSSETRLPPAPPALTPQQPPVAAGVKCRPPWAQLGSQHYLSLHKHPGPPQPPHGPSSLCPRHTCPVCLHGRLPGFAVLQGHQLKSRVEVSLRGQGQGVD